MEKSNSEKLLRTYGRKRAKGLSKAKQDILGNTLNKYRINIPEEKVDPEFFFDGMQSGSYAIVEIGFGNGCHLVDGAFKRRGEIFIGCEPFENGVAKAVDSIEKNGLQNVKIYPGDSRDLLQKLNNESVNEFHIMFPDPWPKKRHIKRRLLSIDFLSWLYRLLKPGGCIRFASDQIHYVKFVLENISIYNDIQKTDSSKFLIFSDELKFLISKPNCWSKTKYEQKALSAGGICYYLRIFK